MVKGELIMKGKCLCGAIEISASNVHDVSICHCSMCRRWSGGPLFAIHGATGVQINGDTLSVYASSAWAERGFCCKCGTHLFYRLVQNNEYFLPAGLFQTAEVELTSEIFIDEKPNFYELNNDTLKMTGQQVFESYTSE